MWMVDLLLIHCVKLVKIASIVPSGSHWTIIEQGKHGNMQWSGERLVTDTQCLS